MIWLAISFFSLIGLSLIFQILGNIRLVSGNELGIVFGGFRRTGFRTFTGGRVFLLPLFQRFAKLDLTPFTIEVVAEAAIAGGIVALDVKASVSLAISTNESLRNRAVTRVLEPSQSRDQLEQLVAGIIEGHLRDAVASLTPESLMADKTALMRTLLEASQTDLADIGLEITTLSIADVEDHRLSQSGEADLYISLIKRIQAADAETQARRAKAEAEAAANEYSFDRWAETEIKKIQNERESLQAEIRLRLAQEDHRRGVESERVTADTKAQLAGIRAEAEADKLRLELVKNRGAAEIVAPARGHSEELVLNAKIEVAQWLEQADAELEQMKEALKTLRAAGPGAENTWLLENIDNLFAPFAATLANYPVEHLSVVTGAVRNEFLAALCDSQPKTPGNIGGSS